MDTEPMEGPSQIAWRRPLRFVSDWIVKCHFDAFPTINIILSG